MILNLLKHNLIFSFFFFESRHIFHLKTIYCFSYWWPVRQIIRHVIPNYSKFYCIQRSLIRPNRTKNRSNWCRYINNFFIIIVYVKKISRTSHIPVTKTIFLNKIGIKCLLQKNESCTLAVLLGIGIS